jgi:PadR family transcriptional regulator PadR
LFLYIGGISLSDEIDNDFSDTEYVNHIMNKENKTIVNGFTHLLILWFLSKEDLHGYALMKRLNEFFSPQIECGFVKKVSSSKIYPILSDMEEYKIIEGEWKVQSSKNIKVYHLTNRGELILEDISKKIQYVYSIKNPLWQEFFQDIFKGSNGK